MKITFILLVIMSLGLTCQSKEKTSVKRDVNAKTSVEKKDIIIKDIWIRQALPPEINGVAYMTLLNPNSKPDALLSIQTDVAEVVEFHKTSFEGNMTKMRRVREIKIPPNDLVQLKQGALHLMLINIKKPLKEGVRISLTFDFKNMGKQVVIAPVLKYYNVESHHEMNHHNDANMKHKNH